MLLKFINGNIVDPGHVIGVLSEPGMTGDGDLSYVLKVLLDTGDKIEAAHLEFHEDAPSDPIEAEFNEHARMTIVNNNLVMIANYLGHGVDCTGVFTDLEEDEERDQELG